ncbi:MAG: hypothetical protein P8J20_12015 [Novosphingobium sp.]|nr:hypothetical protein [Novosphingobium sp.]
MKFVATIKSAALFSVLALGIQGTAFAAPGQGGGPHVRVFNGTDNSVQQRPVVTPKRANKPSSTTPGSVAAKGQTPQPVGLLLPAVQAAREAARR